MKNRYLFFNTENFEGLDLADYTKEDTQIPKTDVHIYTFSYASTDESTDDELRAKKLDELTQLITEKYEEKFQVVGSESSRFFCEKLYPLFAEFETHLRYALYISRAVFDSEKLNTDSFLLDVEKVDKKGKTKKCRIEDMDFSEIYTSIFTDTSLQTKVREKYDAHLTKAELIKRIEAIPEETTWHKWVGSQYPYVEDHFLKIKNYRNDVMHNHLISYDRYSEGKKILERANEEIERVIHDKLITNASEYANRINLFESIGNMAKMSEQLSKAIGKAFANISSAEMIESVSKAITTLANSTLLEGSYSESCEDEQDSPQEDESIHGEEE